MVIDPSKFAARNQAIVKARKTGVGLLMAFFAVGMVVSEFQRLATRPLSPMLVAYLGLFLLTAVLAYLWIASSESELDQLMDWLDPKNYAFPSTFKETLLILLIAAFLIALLFASRDPLAYAAVFTAYSAVALFSTRYVNRVLAVAFQRTRQRIDDDVRSLGPTDRSRLFSEAISVLDTYYLKRPHTERHATILSFSGVAVVLALVARRFPSSVFGLVAYTVLFVTIVCSELVIGYWRGVRNDALKPIQIRRGENEHDENAMRA